jgi:hypothetical protein
MSKGMGSKTHCPLKQSILFQNEWKRERRGAEMNTAAAPIIQLYRMFLKEVIRLQEYYVF